MIIRPLRRAENRNKPCYEESGLAREIHIQSRVSSDEDKKKPVIQNHGLYSYDLK